MVNSLEINEIMFAEVLCLSNSESSVLYMDYFSVDVAFSVICVCVLPTGFKKKWQFLVEKTMAQSHNDSKKHF